MLGVSLIGVVLIPPIPPIAFGAGGADAAPEPGACVAGAAIIGHFIAVIPGVVVVGGGEVAGAPAAST